jgi:hypothetical protein
MTRPAIEVADIVRRKGRQFLERFRAVLSYQQLKACNPLAAQNSTSSTTVSAICQ